MKPFQHARLKPSRLIAPSGGLLLCLGLGLSGPVVAAPEGFPDQPTFADQVRVSRDVLSSTLVDVAESPSSAISAGEGGSLFQEESTGPLQFGASRGVSLVPASVAHGGGSAGLGLKQSSTGSSSVSAWVAAVDSPWFPTLSYTLDQQGVGEFVARDGFATGLADAGSALSTHVVDFGWGGELWHAGYGMNSSVQRQMGQGASETTWKSARDSVYFGLSPGAGLDLTFDLGVERIHDGLSGDVAHWRTRGVSANWALAPRLSLRAGLTEGRSQALDSLSGSRNRTADFTITYRLGSAADEGQLFLRFDRYTFQTDAADFESSGSFSGASVNLGFVVSAF